MDGSRNEEPSSRQEQEHVSASTDDRANTHVEYDWTQTRASPGFWLNTDWANMSSRARRSTWFNAGRPNCPVRGCKVLNHPPPHRPHHSMDEQERAAWLEANQPQAQKRRAEEPAQVEEQNSRGQTATERRGSQQSNQRRRQSRPPPRPCRYCSGGHWEDQCPYHGNEETVRLGRAIINVAAANTARGTDSQIALGQAVLGAAAAMGENRVMNERARGRGGRGRGRGWARGSGS